MGTTNDQESRDKNVESNQPRWFFVGMALFLILFVILGFGSTYGLQLLTGSEISGAGVVETDWVIHIHVIVFFGWMILLLSQTVFVARGQTTMHMATGKTVGLGLVIAILIAGFLITFVRVQSAVAQGLAPWDQWSAHLFGTRQQLMSLLGFLVLVGLGLYSRDKTSSHKRYMIFATILLVTAATSRMEYLFGSWSGAIGLVIMTTPVLLYDLYTDKKLHFATVVGTGILILKLFVWYGVPLLGPGN